MDIVGAVESGRLILTEGSVIEHLHRSGVPLDSHVANAGFVYDDARREAMAGLYRQYLDIGRKHDLPMIVATPTWRANPERIHAAGLVGRDVNADCFRFIADLRTGLGHYARSVFVAGLIGPKGDAYDPSQSLHEEEAARFHHGQADRLAEAGADLLLAATLPAAPEAIGLARAMAGTGLPYILSFVIRPTGVLLDGTPLVTLVAAIDSGISPRPLAYMANCVHPSAFTHALVAATHRSPSIIHRIIGLQANASALNPEQLAGLGHLESSLPGPFAHEMAALHTRFGTRILGGCCGAGPEHIAAIAEAIEALELGK